MLCPVLGTFRTAHGLCFEEDSHRPTNICRGVLGWIFGERLCKLTIFVQGTELLRSDSVTALASEELLRSDSVTALASEELPRVGEGPSSSTTCSQDRLRELLVYGYMYIYLSGFLLHSLLLSD